MWRFFEFLSKYGNFFLFLFLEFIAFLLIINNQKQKSIFNGVVLETSGRVEQVTASVNAYFNLSVQNQKLQQENVELREELMRVMMELNNYKYKVPFSPAYLAVPDTLLPADKLRFIPARVIMNTVHKNLNYFTLDKGSRNGVKKNMGVFTPEGIAGAVVSVSPNFSRVISLLNTRFSLSARLKSNNHVGTISWDGADPEFASLDFIPLNTPLEAGDTVMTSGYSSYFPEGFRIGYVESFTENNEDGFYKINVRLSTDFREVDNVYLVENLYQAEIDTLIAEEAIR